MSVFSIWVGDCFDDSQEVLDAGADVVEFQDLAGLPCSEPHDNEVYAVFDLYLERFRGASALYDMASDECLERFESFVGMSYAESILDIFYLAPTAESWSQGNDREISCAIFHLEGEKLTGSMSGSGI